MPAAYDNIFDGAPWVSLILLVVSGVSVVLQRPSLVARSIAFSFASWLAPLFYVSYMVSVGRSSSAIALATLVDTVLLVVYYLLFKRLVLIVANPTSLDSGTLMKYLKSSIVVVVVLAVPLAFQGGAGIFSATDSRIDYLADSKWNPYLVYGSLLVQAVMIPVIASLVNREKRWNRYVIIYLVFTSTLSVLSGSKGASILSFLAILSLVKFPESSDYFKVLRLPILGILSVFGCTVYFVGRFMALDAMQISSQMLSRIFLSNDARALAIDWSPHINQRGFSLFREAFRGYASLLGSKPMNPPLGQYLYMEQFHATGMIGANTSTSALLIAYGGEFEKVAFALVVCLIAGCVYFLAHYRSRYSIVTGGTAMFLLSLLSQDFLAFQLAVHILIVAAIILASVVAGRHLLVGACKSAHKEVLGCLILKSR